MRIHRTIIPRLKWILPIIAVLAVVTGGGVYQYRRTHIDPCAPTKAMKASLVYDVPCSVGFIIKNSEHPTPERINEIVNSVGGKKDIYLPDINVYYIKVKRGTEEDTIKYLKTLPEVETALHDGCCAVAQ